MKSVYAAERRMALSLLSIRAGVRTLFFALTEEGAKDDRW